ncbi:YidH family protein, partial [Singulisphaera rosea]
VAGAGRTLTTSVSDAANTRLSRGRPASQECVGGGEFVMPEADRLPAPTSRSSTRIRDHLANERTFLAWIRTALGLIGLGFVLARMGLFLKQLAAVGAPEHSRGIRAGHEFLLAGVVFLILGTVFGGVSGWTYQQVCRAIDADRFEPARRPIVALTFIVVVGGLAIVALVVQGTLARGEP